MNFPSVLFWVSDTRVETHAFASSVDGVGINLVINLVSTRVPACLAHRKGKRLLVLLDAVAPASVDVGTA